MKKSILSLAVLLASSVGFSAIAQNPCQPSKACTENNCKAKPCDKKGAPRYCPFEGLNLTDKQKSELQSIAPQNPPRIRKLRLRLKSRPKRKQKPNAVSRLAATILPKSKASSLPSSIFSSSKTTMSTTSTVRVLATVNLTRKTAPTEATRPKA